MKVASFFSGIGGIDLGLENAGMDVEFQCEILKFGQSVLQKHWPGIQLESDITKVQGKDIPDVDVFAGGFPCQDLSLANQGKRKGLEGARSGLFYKYAELIEEKSLAGFLSKMFPAFLTAHKVETLRSSSQRWMNSGMVWHGECWI